MQHEALMGIVRVLVNVLDPPRVERRRAALQAVHLVPLVEQQLRQIGAVLAVTPVMRARLPLLALDIRNPCFCCTCEPA